MHDTTNAMWEGDQEEEEEEVESNQIYPTRQLFNSSRRAAARRSNLLPRINGHFTAHSSSHKTKLWISELKILKNLPRSDFIRFGGTQSESQLHSLMITFKSDWPAGTFKLSSIQQGIISSQSKMNALVHLPLDLNQYQSLLSDSNAKFISYLVCDCQTTRWRS